MLAFIRGKILAKEEDYIIVLNNDLGYKIFVAENILYKYNVLDEVELWLYHHIREDQSSLYGFLSLERQRLFLLFLSINGIGPKVALAILGKYNLDEIYKYLEKEELSAFKSVPGIGNKTALRIMVELKNKLPENNSDLNNVYNIPNDILSALSSLGYKTEEIKAVYAKKPDDLVNIEDQIKWVLKNINK